MLEVDLRCEIIKAVLAISGAETVGAVPPSPSQGDRPRVRMRSKGTNTNKHDARCDAVDYCASQLLRHSDTPYWAAVELGYRFADYAGDQLWSNARPFDAERYEALNHTEWNAKAHELIQHFFHSLGTSEAKLPEPKGWADVKYSVYENRNHKKDMEDKRAIISKLKVVEPTVEHGLDDASLFAVFDGHGGDKVATYASSHVGEAVIHRYKAGDPDFVANSLRDLEKRIIARTSKEQVSGGSTAVVIVWRPDKDLIDYAWIGDSAIGVMTNDDIITLTKPHNLKDPSECERVKAEGGLIMNIYGEDRVNGVLNITRALGDYNAKPMVSGEPGCGQFKPAEAGYHMVFLASDGVWDFATPKMIHKAAVNFIKTHSVDDYKDLSSAITTVALEKSTDNVMLITVFLKTPEEVWKHFGGLPSQGSSGDTKASKTES